MSNTVFEYNGCKVELDSQHKFWVEDLERAYDTAREAKEAIVGKIKADARLKKKKLELPVIGEDGVLRNVTGIHATQDRLLFSGEKWKSYNAPVPAVPWLAEAIDKRQGLLAQVSNLAEVIARFALAEVSSYGSSPYRGKTPDQCYDVLEEDYADKLKAAQETDLGKELEKLQKEKEKKCK